MKGLLRSLARTDSRLDLLDVLQRVVVVVDVVVDVDVRRSELELVA
jgi:hypothetical protein